MKSLKPRPTCDGNPCTGAPDGRASPWSRAAEIGLAGNVATLYRDDPLEAEAAFRDMVFGLARSVIGHVHGKVSKPVDFLRSRYRPSGTGASLVPAEAVPGQTGEAG